VLGPKVPGACSLCDCDSPRDVRHRRRDGTLARIGPHNPGAKRMVLLHRNGSTSSHTLCARCDPEPRHMPALWKRAVMAYALGISAPSPAHAQYAANIPIGILCVQEIE